MNSYTQSLITLKPTEEVYNFLLNINNWWSGFHEETISGSSKNIGDEFSFHAGGGMHVTKQRLIELVPNKKIVWLVTESNLAFLNEPNEWNDTKLIFSITKNTTGETMVQFTHEGLAPQVECYNQCSSAWSQYMEQLEKNLNK